MEYQRLTQLMTSKSTLIKKITPFLLSVSVFSFIFSNSSWHSFLVRFFKSCFFSLPMQVLSHALDKSWIFLICNGILVVIANTSGMVHSGSGSDLNDLLQKKIGDCLQATTASEPENAVPSQGEGEEKENDGTEEEEEEEGEGKDERLAEEQEENYSCLISDDEEQEQGSGFLKTEGGESGAEAQKLQITCINGDDENKEESETCFMLEEEEEQLCDEEEEIDNLSTEELNKKFEDFIRKMKEELRIEAQQQLVMVK